MATNVGFKRGLHAALPTTNAVEGIFYLTTDTERFYVGKNDGTLAELNKSVRTIATLDALKALQEPAMAVGDFYYIIDKNILAVYVEENGTKNWKQVNPDTNDDTKVHSIAFTAATANNIATITETIKLADKAGNVISNADKTATFKIKGGDGVKVSNSGSEITLEGDYGFSVTAGTNAADVNLLASETEEDDFTIAGGDNITVTADATNKKITIDTNKIVSSGSLDFEAATGKIQLILKDKQGNNLVNLSDTDKIFYKIGDEEFVPGSTLDVYSKSDIDTKLNGLNGLTYKGTVGAGGTVSSLPTSGVKAGDMYLVVGSTPVTGSGNSGKPGDLFIATGTEGTDGVISGTITWTYVPSGDDAQTDTTYKAVADTTNHTVTLKDDKGNNQGGIDLDAGDAIELDSTSSTSGNGSILKTTIKHADVSKTTPHTADPTSATIKQIVAAVDVNDQGHVTKVATVAVDGDSLKGYSLTGQKEITASSVKFTHKLATTNGTAKGTIEDNVTSSSLVFAEAKDAQDKVVGYSINLEWGSF